jgi:hypothetical protein
MDPLSSTSSADSSDSPGELFADALELLAEEEHTPERCEALAAELGEQSVRSMGGELRKVIHVQTHDDTVLSDSPSSSRRARYPPQMIPTSHAPSLRLSSVSSARRPHALHFTARRLQRTRPLSTSFSTAHVYVLLWCVHVCVNLMCDLFWMFFFVCVCVCVYSVCVCNCISLHVYANVYGNADVDVRIAMLRGVHNSSFTFCMSLAFLRPQSIAIVCLPAAVNVGSLEYGS